MQAKKCFPYIKPPNPLSHFILYHSPKITSTILILNNLQILLKFFHQIAEKQYNKDAEQGGFLSWQQPQIPQPV